MPLLHRMNKLKELLQIRVGPGAVILPRDVTRIHMLFAKKISKGHFGPRIFWHEYLPRMKYHNPGVSMTVERTDDQSSPAIMTVFYASKRPPNAATATEIAAIGGAGGPAPGGKDQGSSINERMETIDMKHKNEADIYKQLLEITGASEVRPTEEEAEEIERIKREAVEKAIDSEKKKAVMEKIRAEQRLEKQAREAAAAAV